MHGVYISNGAQRLCSPVLSNVLGNCSVNKKCENGLPVRCTNNKVLLVKSIERWREWGREIKEEGREKISEIEESEKER